MANELVKQEQQVTRPLTVDEMKNQIQTIQQVMKGVMQRGAHFDILPGCGEKPVLLKPGAEKILATFRIGTELIIEDLSDGFDHTYRVKCKGFYIPTGNIIGEGIGECSTREKKYAWRAAACQGEYDATTSEHRQIAWKPKKNEKGYNIKGEAVEELQVRQNPADLANTVLKMAKKRAMVDLCLTATACSDIFEQDLDEENIREATSRNEQPQGNNYKKPQRREQQQTASGSQNNGNGVKTITEAQEKRLWAIAASNNVPREEVEYCLSTTYNVKTAAELPMAAYDGFIEWLQLPVAPAEGNAQ